MNASQLIQEALTQLLQIPDSTGLTRCANFCQLYATLDLLKNKVQEEKTEYERRIAELEGKLQHYTVDGGDQNERE